MSSGNSPLDNSNSEPLTRSYSERNSDRNRDYDGLKQQCDKAIHELQQLRRQNNETNRRCEQTMKEKEYYRSQHHAAMSQLEAAAEESSALRTKYSELVSDKVRLDREISELRSSCCNQGDVGSGESGADGFSNRFIVTINKYEALKNDYESIHQRYDDLLASHKNAIDKLDFNQEEVSRLNKRIEQMMVEHNSVVLERNGLQQQCTQAVRKWDITLRERERLEDDLKKLQQQHEDAMKDVITLRRSLTRLTQERDAAVQEYNLIMSERDTVHKEMNKLTEDLSQAYKKIKLLENEVKDHVEQKKTFSYHIETLKREIASALHDRDKALKECNDFREKFGELTLKEKSQREAFKTRFDYSYIRERDASHKNSCEMQSTSMDLFSKCQKETMDNLDQANQEIERLRKYIDKQQSELQDALQEAEVSKRRRDWAFDERDKIVLERESIRTLCDRLRKERDRAVSDLAEALRDSDDIKRQRNETTKELKDLKEKMEAQLEKENRMMQLNTTGHNYSHDSAIDTDLQEWDTEMLNINLNALTTGDDLGVELVGGRDDPYYPNDSGIYVSSVSKGSIVEGKLRVNDCILRVNNLDCSNVSKRMIIETVRSSGGNCNILVKRRRIGARSLFTTQLQLNNYDHGLLLETGMYICKITPGSLAAKEGNLAVGDRVLTINNKPMDGLKSAQEAMAILNEPTDVLIISTLKSTYCSSNCGGGSNKDVYKKYTNSSTQTEQRLNFIRYDNRQSCPVSPNSQVEKSSLHMGKWNTVIRAKDFVRGRRILKPEKKLNRNSSPVTFDQEKDDAIAELDSVIDSYHTKHTTRQQQLQQQQLQTIQRKPQRSKEPEKNGGTWPKARIGPIIENATGTIMHPRKKDRLPLSLLLSHAPNYNGPQSFCPNSNPNDGCSPVPKDSLDYSVQSGNMGKDVLEYYAKKNATKYAVNDVVDSTSEPHSRTNSQIYGSPYSLTPFIPISHQGQLLDSRYPSSIIPSSQSGESLSLTDPRTYCFEPSYKTMAQFHHKHSPSADSYHKLKTIGPSSPHPHSSLGFRSPELTESYHRYEGGTFPRKKENQRFRIPSNSSVASKNSGKLSTGSIEKSSERGSPVPTFQVKLLNNRQNKRNSLPNYCWSHKPAPGDERIVKIEKSSDPLGISIQCLENGAVFVSNVEQDSLASQVGLQVGDQLLEVCGINMRNAPHEWAERVLGNCGDSITMHVQYNPHKYNTVSGSDSSATSGDEESRSDSHSGSPTPCNSPKLSRKSTPSSTLSHVPYTHTVTTLTRPKPSEKMIDSNKGTIHEPRYLVLETHKCSNLGISLVGGNAVGIYVHSVAPNSLAYNAGLRMGDHILEYNGTDLRHATAEEAAFEMAKPTAKVKVLVQNDLERYNLIKDKPGDSFYIRALFDRTGDLGDSSQLQFCKDDVLYVDNTMLNGVPGNWRAWLIDQDGYHQQCGIIPSKYKVEEELLKRSLGDLEGDARRGTRRSFFRRKKQRSDSKMLASFSNINLDWFSDSGSLNDETSLASYQKVTRLNSEPMLRPVVIVGPLADCVTEKLLTDFPDKFNRCIPEIQYNSQAFMEKCLSDNILIDYRKKGNAFECITIAALKESFNKHCHCILRINLASVKRLHSHHIYPIVLLIKFKSTKQIKEVKDTRYLSDKTSAKAAKEMYEHALKLESEYRHYISAVIPAGVNVAYMCTQIKAAVDSEQNKTIWVPSSSS